MQQYETTTMKNYKQNTYTNTYEQIRTNINRLNNKT